MHEGPCSHRAGFLQRGSKRSPAIERRGIAASTQRMHDLVPVLDFEERRLATAMELFQLFLAILGLLSNTQANPEHEPRTQACAGDTLSIQAGYHVIYSWPGPTIPQHLYDLTSAGKVGGVIIFTENVNDDLPAQIQKLQDTYASSSAYAGFPLLITTDQEGGEVFRLPGGPELSAKEIGASPDPVTEASRAGNAAAKACVAYGVNGNLAPVVDVFRKSGDFDDQYMRSYSMDPDVVDECATVFIEAQQARGVVATAKHFPGLGAATAEQDTDEEPVVLDVSLPGLRTIDELPFQGAIAAGVEMIMTSWAIYPTRDPERPAGLSSKWIRDELRGRLGFDRVVISDAIEAGSLMKYGTNATRGVLAVEAGVDIALASGRDVEQGESIHGALVAALKDGALVRKNFGASTTRILALRRDLVAK